MLDGSLQVGVLLLELFKLEPFALQCVLNFLLNYGVNFVDLFAGLREFILVLFAILYSV